MADPWAVTDKRAVNEWDVVGTEPDQHQAAPAPFPTDPHAGMAHTEPAMPDLPGAPGWQRMLGGAYGAVLEANKLISQGAAAVSLPQSKEDLAEAVRIQNEHQAYMATL